MSSRDVTEVILLPRQGFRAAAQDTSVSTAFFCNLGADRPISQGQAAPQPQFEFNLEVLDAIHGNGAKLCRLDPIHVGSIRTKYPGVRIVPVSFCEPAIKVRPAARRRRTATSSRSGQTVIRVVSEADGQPVPRAFVQAFTDFDESIGDERTTNSRGEVHLSLDGARTIERLFVDPLANFWSFEAEDVLVRRTLEFELKPLDLDYTDCLRFFYGDASLDAGEGVMVGVVDSGIAEHRDLRIDGGENVVRNEERNAIGDSGLGHGTHVAGIVAARGERGRGVRGVAPGVSLKSYRVFGKGRSSTSVFNIAKGIDQAVEDGCDLINVSIVGKRHSVLTAEAIADARDRGTVVIAAAGNDGRKAVSFPAAEGVAIAVSAMGRKRTFPRSSMHRDEIARPFGTDPNDFFAEFSNVGVEVDLVGPGVAIISTLPQGYAAWDGTSMACPAVTGAIARLISQDRRILSMPRTAARADAITELAFRAATRMGFGPNNEGVGRIKL